METLYHNGDFVRYLGGEFAEIVDISEDGKFYTLDLLISKKRVDKELQFIENIETQAWHLTKLGFKHKIDDELAAHIYSNESLCIAKLGRIQKWGFLFDSGFCQISSASISTLNLKDYITKDYFRFNSENFFKDFPCMWNLNRVIDSMLEKKLLNMTKKEALEMVLLKSKEAITASFD